MFRIVALLASSLLIIPPVAMAQGLSPSSRDTFERQEDLLIPVEVTSGSCPTQVRFWQESHRHFEAGDNSGIMLDVSTIGQGKTEFIDSQDYSVTFKTPLSPKFYSCVGRLGDSEDHYRSLYDLWFVQGHVFFRFDITPIAPAPEENWYFATITHQEILGQYPYVRWAAGD
ncbi:MAG: hypothetical protein AAF243_14515 [Cyanobacteria bacterium P01_A01_bin.137]